MKNLTWKLKIIHIIEQQMFLGMKRGELFMKHDQWKCIKCDNDEFEEDQIATTGSFWSKFFNIQNKKFTTITCTKCTYTEMYRTESSTIENVLDFFGN